MLKFNENNDVITEERYRAILVGLQTGGDISYSMEELAGLAEAANAQVLGKIVQVLDRPNTATFVGKGKTEEIRELAPETLPEEKPSLMERLKADRPEHEARQAAPLMAERER